MRVRIVAALCLLFACYPRGWREESPLYLERSSVFDVGPYVVYGGPGIISVVVEHDLSTAPVVRWGIKPPESSTVAPKLTDVTMVEDNDLWVGELKDLPLDTALIYQVEHEIGTVGPFPFRGGRTKGRRFRFVSFGDTRTGHKVHRGLIEQMAKEGDVDLVIHSGDLVESGGVYEQWVRFFQIEAPMIRSTPLFAALGNHDLSPRNYFERYTLASRYADGKRYTYREWGDIRVIMMDSELEARTGSPQYEFLETAMREGAEKGQLMLVALHHPPYSAGAHGSNLELREVLGELCPRFGVEVVLAGHDHNYERTKRIDGVTYFVAASGGAPIRRMTPSWFSEVVRTEPHYILFDVERGSLVGRAVNLNGETFDTFVIPPLDPQPKKAP